MQQKKIQMTPRRNIRSVCSVMYLIIKLPYTYIFHILTSYIFMHLHYTCICNNFEMQRKWDFALPCYDLRVFTMYITPSWWRHQMETLSALLALGAGNSPVPDEFFAQRPVTRSFYVFFDLRLNKRLSKQSWDWWCETQSGSLWRHCNVCIDTVSQCDITRIFTKSLSGQL